MLFNLQSASCLMFHFIIRSLVVTLQHESDLCQNAIAIFSKCENEIYLIDYQIKNAPIIFLTKLFDEIWHKS